MINIDSGLDKDIINPDVGANIEKNVQFLSLSYKEAQDPLSLENFPEREFEVGSKKFLTTCYSQIWKYSIEYVEFKRKLSVEKPFVKGYNFYKSGNLLEERYRNWTCLHNSSQYPCYCRCT